MKRLLLLAALLTPLPAMAQALQCSPPARLAPQPPVRQDEPGRQGPVAFLSLMLSWSPAFCHSPAGHRSPDQCDGRMGRFGFVLHGLWPEGSGPQDYPRWCAAAPRPDPELLRRNLCLMPSARTLEHEWLKHGTCAFRTPQDYFGAAARAFTALHLPDMARLSAARGVRVGDLRAAFAKANPALPVAAIGVQTRGPWLDSVRICLGRDLRATACPGWARGAGDGAPLRIDPVG